MRARGAKVTDIAILVVAADDGVMPQTIEALNHAQAADVPIVVAVNKIDKEGANPDKVRQQLTEYNLVAEEYGGETMFVNVSARTGENIDSLLEAVLLTADAALDLRANPDKDARGVAIETHLDKGRGPVATVLVQSGTLHVGDAIVAGSGFGRVRAMLDEYGNTLTEATPSRPVLVLGLTSVPGAGDTFLVAPDDRTARQIAERKEAASRAASLAKARKRISLEDFNEALAAGKVETLNLILKGDASGSVEALEDALLQIDVGDEVDLRIIDRGVGAITLNNINLAVASDAIIIGFNVRAEGHNADVADREGVEIRYYSVIYQAIEEIEAALKGMLKPEFEEVRLGEAEIREIFRSSKFGNIAGSIVRNGRDPPRRSRPDPAQWHGHRGEPRDRRAAPVQGRRHRGPRGLRVRHQPGLVQRSPDRRHDPDVRDAREAEGLTPGATLRRPVLSRAGRRFHAYATAVKGWCHGRPSTRPQDRRPDQGGRRRDARAPRQGRAARLHDDHRRPRDRRPPERDGVLHVLRVRRRARGLRGGPRVGQGPAAHRGRQSARHPAHTDARVHPGRASPKGPRTWKTCWSRRGRPTPSWPASREGAVYAGDPDPYKKPDDDDLDDEPDAD